jgi:hypothetical protein
VRGNRQELNCLTDIYTASAVVKSKQFSPKLKASGFGSNHTIAQWLDSRFPNGNR